ncbi:MAG: ABC transporter ATP-binding protein [Myxococcales bacterium]|nr:ABC transporter ATP-binding protein [Myxococcales bacterium]MCB9536839.1 ABC transporter ATP-binding protein [Myxococcales bacterium]
MAPPILEVSNLRTYFKTAAGVARAVDDVSFSVAPGETLGIVGESGCGKSVTSLSIMRLVPQPPGYHPSGVIRFDGQDLLQLPERAMRKLRGADVAMIFQEPMTSLNPIFRVGSQIGESLRQHKGLTRKDARLEAIRLLERVGIPDPSKRVDDFPHQMSGGMKQRVMIAMALACNPKLLIADEPTTALDVTIQAQILDLLRDLQAEFNMAILLITHDLGVVAEMAHRVVVMYGGRIAEQAPVEELFAEPRHPYTLGLFRSLPDLDAKRSDRLAVIPGMVPSATAFPSGCRFRNRCAFATDACAEELPSLVKVGAVHDAACIHLDRVAEAQAAG